MLDFALYYLYRQVDSIQRNLVCDKPDLVLKAEHERLEVCVEILATTSSVMSTIEAAKKPTGVVEGYMQPSERLHRDVHHLLAVLFLT